MASHARSSNYSGSAGDIIGDFSVPLLHSRFCPRPFLCLLPVATVAASLLFFLFFRERSTRRSYSLANGVMRDYYLICIAVKLLSVSVNETTIAFAPDEIYLTSAHCSAAEEARRGILIRGGEHRARRGNVILTCP